MPNVRPARHPRLDLARPGPSLPRARGTQTCRCRLAARPPGNISDLFLGNHHTDRQGRITLALLPTAWRRDLLSLGLVEIPVDGAIGIAAAQLDLHGDPADRIIAATAQMKGAVLRQPTSRYCNGTTRWNVATRGDKGRAVSNSFHRFQYSAIQSIIKIQQSEPLSFCSEHTLVSPWLESAVFRYQSG